MNGLFQRWQVRAMTMVGIAALLAWTVSSEWFGNRAAWLADGLFTFFLPGTLVVGALTGGTHSLSEFDVGIGAFAQTLLIWGIGEWLGGLRRQRKMHAK